MGCQQDVVRVMGAVTGVVVNPRPPESSEPKREAKHEAIPQVADASQPSDAAGDPATATDAAPESSAAASAPASSSFNPISMPEGPRDTPGVRWDGVRGHTQEAIAEERRLRKLDNP
jgi:hypothetical protein